jgi:hypothetical protein
MMNHPEVTDVALSILRRGDNFQWYVIAFEAMAVFAGELGWI